jgi:choline kinase
MKIVILAAGKGSRLGDPDRPKPLTLLSDGKSILRHQIDSLKPHVSVHDIYVIVGFHMEQIMREFPDLLFVHNPDYASENTAKSLLRALHKIDDDLLWINGDVVFHPSILEGIFNFHHNCMVVNRAAVGEEEVKYHCASNGWIDEVSKEVRNAQGEALGINFLKRKDLPLFKECLAACGQNDYFEKGLEKAIHQGLEIRPYPIDGELCTEVDFPEDLERANNLIRKWAH